VNHMSPPEIFNIDFAYFYDFSIGSWDFSDSVECVVFLFIIEKGNVFQMSVLRIGECPTLHSLKIMEPRPRRGRVPLFLRNGEIRGHSPT
jgi:hypothetical protein